MGTTFPIHFPVNSVTVHVYVNVFLRGNLEHVPGRVIKTSLKPIYTKYILNHIWSELSECDYFNYSYISRNKMFFIHALQNVQVSQDAKLQQVRKQAAL